MTRDITDGEWTLANCDREPIHVPGSIQPHGVLLGVTPDLRVAVSSQTAADILGVVDVHGCRLQEVLGEDATNRLRETMGRQPRVRRDTLEITTEQGQAFDLSFHDVGGLTLLELEPVGTQTPAMQAPAPQTLATIMAELRSTVSLEATTTKIAHWMRRITGYDRCMVYRFDPAGNGEVVAESREEKLAPYLGLHYPAADIPPQARRLYMTNTLRLIVDVNYEPSPLTPAVDPKTELPLDMSECTLRSVSPFHRQYLQNMGVRGTLAVSLMVEDQLWGLLVCHHYEPRHIRAQSRAACEVLGLFLTQRIAETEKRSANDRLARMKDAVATLVQSNVALTSADDEAMTALTECQYVLQCTALVVKTDGNLLSVGAHVDRTALANFLARVDELTPDAIFETDQLSALGPAAESLAQHYAGALAARVTTTGEWVVALRREQVQDVTWGSAKEKTFTIEDGVPRLSPEGSFGLWKETVRGRCRAWSPVEHRLMADLQSAVRSQEASQLEALAQKARELQRMTEAKDEFLTQLSHELRNPLNAVLGWADMLLLDTHGLEGRTRRGLEVIRRNTVAQARLIDDLLDVSRIVKGNLRLELQAAGVEPLLRSALESTQSGLESKQISLSTIIDPGVAPVNADPVRLQQVIWNLLSNAVKFTPKGGKIWVSLEEVDSSVRLSVENLGDGIEPELLPHLFDRFRQGKAGYRARAGLGLGLAIAKGIVELHGGTIGAKNTDRGACFWFRLPILALAGTETESETNPPSQFEARELAEGLLRGCSILLVEDELEALEVLTHVLRDAGATVFSHSDAESLLAAPLPKVDLVISDLGLPKMGGLELMKTLRSKGVHCPAIALTAYASRSHQLASLRAGFNIHLPKPADREQLVVSVASLLGRFESR